LTRRCNRCCRTIRYDPPTCGPELPISKALIGSGRKWDARPRSSRRTPSPCAYGGDRMRSCHSRQIKSRRHFWRLIDTPEQLHAFPAGDDAHLRRNPCQLRARPGLASRRHSQYRVVVVPHHGRRRAECLTHSQGGRLIGRGGSAPCQFRRIGCAIAVYCKAGAVRTAVCHHRKHPRTQSRKLRFQGRIGQKQPMMPRMSYVLASREPQ
jgi:hypothetical protein